MWTTAAVAVMAAVGVSSAVASEGSVGTAAADDGGMLWKYNEGQDDDWQKNANASASSDVDAGWPTLPDEFEFNANSWYWFRGHLTTPATMPVCHGDGPSHACRNVSTAGMCLGVWVNMGSGGGVYTNGTLQARFSSDHPANVLLTDHAVPGAPMIVAVRVWTDRGSSNFSLHSGRPLFTTHNCTRVRTPVPVDVDAAAPVAGALPRPFSSISMPVDWPEYDDAYRDRMKAAGVRHVRMDHFLDDLDETYNFTVIDKKIDYLKSMGAEPIFCLSYMPSFLRCRADVDMRAAPANFSEWGALVERVVRHLNVEKAYNVRYFEVWNEPNSPSWYCPPDPRTDQGDLASFLRFYAATASAVKRADPTALVGGPAEAAGPFNASSCGSCIRGSLFADGLASYCGSNGVPLDFVTWHEYFQSPDVFASEIAEWRQLASSNGLNPADVHFITESNYAWWNEFTQSHELGAAWIANTYTRFAIPHRLTGHCLFTGRDTQGQWPNGDWGVVTRDNRAKATFNVFRMFNMLEVGLLVNRSEDESVSFVASAGPAGRVTVAVVNFYQGGGPPVDVAVRVTGMRRAEGNFTAYVVDPDHCNLFEPNSDGELMPLTTGAYAGGEVALTQRMRNNAVLLVVAE